MMYLNNAGAGIPSDATFEVVIRHLELEREIGAYDAAKTARPEYDAFYDRAARLIGAKASEIAFVDSASRAWNVAIAAVGISAGGRIVTLASEFGTNLVSLFRLAERQSAEVTVVDCAQDGSFDMSEFERACDGASLVALSHSVAHGSIVNPVVEVGAVAKRAGALYLVDGCQAAGQLEVDVEAIGCDAYTVTGRKWLRGPRGTGFLYVREGSGLVTADVDLSSADLAFMPGTRTVVGVTTRSDARQFELWERNVAGMLGLSHAIQESFGPTVVGTRPMIGELGDKVREAVVRNPLLSLFGEARSPVGNVGFYCLDPAHEDRVERSLREAGIVFSTMSDWDFPLQFPTNGATKLFRLSPHYYTPVDTVSVACEALDRVQ